MTLSKGHRSVPLYLEKTSLPMRALASGHESSSAAMTDTTMPGAAPLVEHHDCQGCDLFETSPLEAVRASIREVGMPFLRNETSALWLRLCEKELMEYEPKAQDAFLTGRREHLQSAVEPVAPQLLPTPIPPSLEEVKRHQVTHLPSAKWV